MKVINVFVILSLFTTYLKAEESLQDRLSKFRTDNGVSNSGSGIKGTPSLNDRSPENVMVASRTCEAVPKSVPLEVMDALAKNGKFDISVNESSNTVTFSNLYFHQCINKHINIAFDKNAGIPGHAVFNAVFVADSSMEKLTTCISDLLEENDSAKTLKEYNPGSFILSDFGGDSAKVVWGFKGAEPLFSDLAESVSVDEEVEGNCFKLQSIGSKYVYTEEGRRLDRVKKVCEAPTAESIIDELGRNEDYLAAQRILQHSGMDYFEELITQYIEEVDTTDPPSSVTSSGDLKNFHERLKDFLVGEDEEGGLIARWIEIKDKDDDKYRDEQKKIERFLKGVRDIFRSDKEVPRYLLANEAYEDYEHSSFNGAVTNLVLTSGKKKLASLVRRATSEQRRAKSTAGRREKQVEKENELQDILEGNFDPHNPKSEIYNRRYADKMRNYRQQQEQLQRHQRDSQRQITRHCHGIIQNRFFQMQLPRSNSQRNYNNCNNLQQNLGRQGQQIQYGMNRTLQQAQGFQREASIYSQYEQMGWQRRMEEEAYFDGYGDSDYLHSPFLDDYDSYLDYGSMSSRDPSNYGYRMPGMNIDPSLYAMGSPAGPGMSSGFGRDPFAIHSQSMFNNQAPGRYPPNFDPRSNGVPSYRGPAGYFHN